MWTESVLSEKPNFRSEPKECENKPEPSMKLQLSWQFISFLMLRID